MKTRRIVLNLKESDAQLLLDHLKKDTVQNIRIHKIINRIDFSINKPKEVLYEEPIN